jgi:hypothetical protein
MSPIPDAPSLLAYVDKECSDKPIGGVFSVSIKLYRDMQKK